MKIEGALKIASAKLSPLLREEVLLLPQKAVFLKERSTLLISDVHIGKAATFRQQHYFAPDGVLESDLMRLSAVVKALSVRRLIVLGDLLHGRHIDENEVKLFGNFLNDMNLETWLVIGNHDRKGVLPPSWQINSAPEMREDNLCFAHEPNVVEGKFLFCGHIHPAVMLRGKGREQLRLPCFWLKSGSMVLPSFGRFTGSHLISPGKNDRIFVAADDEVIQL